MSKTIEVTPFAVEIGAETATFRFDPATFEKGHEYPPNLAGMIAGVCEVHAADFAGRRIVIDLEDLPAISSKQLGAMLAVRQSCAADGRVRLLNLRPNVRELLHVTKLGDFFDWD